MTKLFEEKNYSTKQLVRDLWSYIRPYRVKFLVATLLGAIGDIAFIYVPYAMAQMITFLTNFSTGDSLTKLWWLLGTWTVAYFIRHAGQQAARFLAYQISEYGLIDIETRAVEHLTKLDLSWHEQENSGSKIKRIQKGAEAFRTIMRAWIDVIVSITVYCTVIIVVVSKTDWRIALFLVFVMAVYMLFAKPLTRRARKASRETNEQEEIIGGFAFEIVNNIRTIKVMGLFPPLFEEFRRLTARLAATIRKRIKYYRSRSFLLGAWVQIPRFFGVTFIVWGIVHGWYELGFLVLFNMYYTQIRDSAEKITEVTEEFAISKISLARLNTLTTTPIVIDNELGKTVFPANWSTLSLNNVSFAYGENTVLKNISLTIKRGEKIGIVGLSGAGKSTLFKLLLKEHENFSGEITFDTTSIRDIGKRSFVEHTAVVLQETEVFNFSLRENITIASDRNRKNVALLEKALDVAHVTDFLSRLPDGVDTLIGEKGIKLSGGEKQRVGIARAIFKEPQILFLDEATSHLDLESEEKIQDSLHQFFQSVTAIVIAHRLTTIKEMDRILVVENGTVIESGSFDELYRMNGRFFELWEKQGL